MPKRGRRVAAQVQNVLTSEGAERTREFLRRAIAGEQLPEAQVRAFIRSRYYRTAMDPNVPRNQQLAALAALDAMTPPEPPKREESDLPTPADARALIRRYFGDDITPPEPSAEVDGRVDAFPFGDLAGAP